MYHVETKDVYADMFDDAHVFDCSDYPEDHPVFDKTNAHIGKFKDETKGVRILEFVGPKTKMYALRTEDGKVKKNAKGVSRPVKRELGFEEYKATVFDQSTITKEMYSIRSFKHV